MSRYHVKLTLSISLTLMGTASDVLREPAELALKRATKTLESLFHRLRPRDLGPLQTADTESTFLIEVARLAVEAGTTETARTDLQRARLRGLSRVAELRKLGEPYLGTGQVCELLGVSRETIRKKVDRKQLLALPRGSEDRVFPAFQFGEGRTVPGVKEVLQILPGDSPFLALSFFMSRSPSFGNKTAIEALLAGNTQAVIAEAGSLLDHGS